MGKTKNVLETSNVDSYTTQGHRNVTDKDKLVLINMFEMQIPGYFSFLDGYDPEGQLSKRFRSDVTVKMEENFIPKVEGVVVEDYSDISPEGDFGIDEANNIQLEGELDMSVEDVDVEIHNVDDILDIEPDDKESIKMTGTLEFPKLTDKTATSKTSEENDVLDDEMVHLLSSALCNHGFTMDAVHDMLKKYISHYQIDRIMFASLMTAEIFAKYTLAPYENDGEEKIDLESIDSLCIYADAIKDGQWICNDIYELDPEKRAVFENDGVKAQVILPLYVRQQLFGVAIIAQTTSPREWSNQELNIFRKMVNVTSDILKQRLIKIS